MKRLLIMLGVFAVLVAFMVVDLYYTQTFYTATHKNLLAANESIEKDTENIDRTETIALTRLANDEWESGKKKLMMLVNHNIVRQVDERFVALIRQVETNNYIDATVTINTLMSLIKDLREENVPSIVNIL